MLSKSDRFMGRSTWIPETESQGPESGRYEFQVECPVEGGQYSRYAAKDDLLRAQTRSGGMKRSIRRFTRHERLLETSKAQPRVYRAAELDDAGEQRLSSDRRWMQPSCAAAASTHRRGPHRQRPCAGTQELTQRLAPLDGVSCGASRILAR